ncbi:adenosine deaminase [Ornithinimicrobium sp. W1679]|uniref:adenosine deaminase n=1 Tax=Ornithinimicrobium sp. W1679 TaxID=3418770 RepID=UPI003CF43FDC
MTRPVRTLPKAHLHLHFTGSMRVSTVRDLAEQHGLRLPHAFTSDWPPQLSGHDERGWFRFQRLYDAARACVRGEADMRRIVREAAEDDAAEGSRWLELQVDPTSYAPFVGGITPALEIVLDEARTASADTGTHVAVVVAASRMRHPLEARTLARLAARHAGEGAGTVVGFGLSNDERRGMTSEFAPAFRIAARAGLASVPHAGELLGADHVHVALEHLRPDRLGHGVRAAEDPAVLARVVQEEVTLEVCPTSNVALGVYPTLADVPLRRLLDAGARVALGADDPLLFGSRLVAQYESARRDQGLPDEVLAELARASVRGSSAPAAVRAGLLTAVDDWLAGDPHDADETRDVDGVDGVDGRGDGPSRAGARPV